MNQNEIIAIIQTKESWDSKSLIDVIKDIDKKQINIDFCYIGGYELLTDGTKTKTCKSLKDIQILLDDFEVEYDETISDPYQLAESVRCEWKETWNDGGGSGWIKLNIHD